MTTILDKINLTGPEIIEPKEFFLEDTLFHLFLVPKSPDVLETPIMEVKLTKDKEFHEFPFTPNCWGPELINKVKITQEVLNKFRVFWGAE